MNPIALASDPRPRILAASLALAASTLLAQAALAWTPVTRTSSVSQGPLEVSVKVGNKTTPLYQSADRQDRWYLQAKKGGNYEIRVRNTTGERIAFVIAVDGLNAINGTRTHMGSDEPMYVLDPWQSTTVKGWRKDLGNVSKFVFVDEERSYAARTDQANGDLGWIRVSAFKEFRPVAWGQDVRLYRDGGSRERAASPQAAPSQPEAKDEVSKRKANGMESDSYNEPQADAAPGTGWGSNARDKVRRVEFTPERFATTQVVLRYEYASGLTALGIFPYREPSRLWERDNGTLGFAQPPTRW